MIAHVRASWSSLKQRYADLLAEYGKAAVAMWFAIFLITLSGFYVAIANGVDPDGLASQAGTLGGAYVATQATKPIRLVLTLLLTPPAVAAWHRLRPAT